MWDNLPTELQALVPVLIGLFVSCIVIFFAAAIYRVATGSIQKSDDD